MGRSRKGVRFPNRRNSNEHLSGSEGRRSSFSDVSEDGSPSKAGASQSKLATVEEVGEQEFIC